MPLSAIRPRETRLPIDVVRESVSTQPFVLKVINRTTEDVTLSLYRIDNFDIDFANNFFYWNEIKNTETPYGEIKILMVPFQFVGED